MKKLLKRRILGDDGNVAIIRWSRTKDPAAIAAPEGLIDPFVHLLCFYNGAKPLAVLTYYATHPQSYYGKGEVSCDFVGIAREMRQRAEGAVHIHFNGAGGNITAGKYNDGSEERRSMLAHRLAAGMKRAWDVVKKTLENPEAKPTERLSAANQLAWFQRNASEKKLDVSCLKVGPAYLLHLPGELFIEYQLAAQKLKPGRPVYMAAYGDYGPGYIGTTISYSQGGYETQPGVSLVSSEVEPLLMDVIRKLLK